MLEQVIVSKPLNPIEFLIELLRRDNNDGEIFYYACSTYITISFIRYITSNTLYYCIVFYWGKNIIYMYMYKYKEIL